MIDPKLIPGFDDEILKILRDNNSRFGTGAAKIRAEAMPEGYPHLELADVIARLEYLTDKKLIMEVEKNIHVSVRAWKLTDAGRDYLDEHVL